MVEVFIGNGCAVIEFNTGFTKRGAFDIFAKIVNIGFHVIRLCVEMNNPRGVIELGSPGIKECV